VTPITLHIVEAYSLCPRKAFLLQRGEPLGEPHEYVRIIEEQEAANRRAYRASLAGAANAIDARGPANLMAGHHVILDAVVVADDLEARCDALKRGKATADQKGYDYEPVKVLGTGRVTKSQILSLAYVGHVLGHVQPRPNATERACSRSCARTASRGTTTWRSGQSGSWRSSGRSQEPSSSG
jgi:hypothetical protein